jgi:hypothetical protein
VDISIPEASATTTSTAVPDPVAPAEAGSVVAAVEAFLTAEVSGDLAGAHALLSSNDRVELATPADWEAVHADLLPPITGFEIGATTTSDGGFIVTTTLEQEAGLDSVLGLITGSATADWAAVEESDGWRIDLATSSITPIYPTDSSAPEAAAAWADDPCSSPPLIGYAAGVAELCEAGGPVEVGEPVLLDEASDLAPFVAAYGPEVATWARSVSIGGPVSLRAVLAPIGEEWQVIGALPAEGG